MWPLCLSRSVEDESRVNGGQRLSPVATRIDSHIRGFQGLHMFCLQVRVEVQLAFTCSFVALAIKGSMENTDKAQLNIVDLLHT